MYSFLYFYLWFYYCICSGKGLAGVWFSLST